MFTESFIPTVEEAATQGNNGVGPILGPVSADHSQPGSDDEIASSRDDTGACAQARNARYDPLASNDLVGSQQSQLRQSCRGPHDLNASGRFPANLKAATLAEFPSQLSDFLPKSCCLLAKDASGCCEWRIPSGPRWMTVGTLLGLPAATDREFDRFTDRLHDAGQPSQSARHRHVCNPENRPRTMPMPDKTSSNFGCGSFPTRSVSVRLSRATICYTFATESFGRPVMRADKRALPGASAQRRLLVIGTHTTVAIRLRFKSSH